MLRAERLERARLSLEGLSIGDAFGECFFRPSEVMALGSRAMPAPPWTWTDDTAMALSVVEVLEQFEGIDPDALAAAFARRYAAEPMRGYGLGAHNILRQIVRGGSWREAALAAFEGKGSMGNGAAMRAAPIGGYFADSLDNVVAHARLSAAPTHAHPDGVAGAIAVALAAAIAPSLRGTDLLRAVAERTPEGATRVGILRAARMAPGLNAKAVVKELGNGAQVLSSDTVPFALYTAAHHGADFEEALWFTVAGLGDSDTTCAIVGGIASLVAPAIPDAFRQSREPLPL